MTLSSKQLILHTKIQDDNKAMGYKFSFCHFSDQPVLANNSVY